LTTDDIFKDELHPAQTPDKSDAICHTFNDNVMLSRQLSLTPALDSWKQSFNILTSRCVSMMY